MTSSTGSQKVDLSVPFVEGVVEALGRRNEFKFANPELTLKAFETAAQLREEKYVKFENALQERAEALLKLASESGARLSKLDETYVARGNELDAFRLGIVSSVDSTLNESRARVQKAEEDLKAQMALQAPVIYWSAKRKAHRVWAGAWFGAMGATVVGSIWVMFWYLRHGSEWMTFTIGSEPATFIAGFLFIASLVYWLCRFTARQYYNQHFLVHDAQERVTMVQTLLALMKTDEARESIGAKEHIGIVLAALFRPANPGTPETGPTPFYEAILNLIPKR
jgi:hypothetical protein